MASIEKEYFDTFGLFLPLPANIHFDEIDRVGREAIAAGKPIPDDYDWWDFLPDGAVS